VIALIIVAMICITALTALGLVLDFSSEVLAAPDGRSKSLRDVAVLLRAIAALAEAVMSAVSRIFRRGG
jgi:hypothetical protein